MKDLYTHIVERIGNNIAQHTEPRRNQLTKGRRKKGSCGCGSSSGCGYERSYSSGCGYSGGCGWHRRSYYGGCGSSAGCGSSHC